MASPKAKTQANKTEGRQDTRENTSRNQRDTFKFAILNRTWLVHTLLNVTNANVCASIVAGKSTLASTKGIKTALSKS
jgi:hypothetical protein